MNHRAVRLLLLSIFLLSSITPLGYNSGKAADQGIYQRYQMSENLPSNSTYLNAMRDSLNVRVYSEGNAMKGLNLFTINPYPNFTSSNTRYSYMLIADMEGNVINGFFEAEKAQGAPQFINSSTVMYANKATGNISFWNTLNNKTEDIDSPSGHHDMEYSPVTDTFAVIERADFQEVEFEGEMATVLGDDVVEYDREGNELWRWEGNLTFPYDEDEFMLRNETKKTNLDWMHSNSLYWDIDEGALYLNVRHLDCVVKIDHNTGQTVWVAGRYTGSGPALDLYGQDGSPVDAIFYHAHACEVIGDNRFIIFDNDYYNLTRPNPELGLNRYVEFAVDEEDMTATEVWAWTAPESYYHRAQGDANRLPNGNTFGCHNKVPEPIVTEVNPEGEIVWEWVFNLTNDVGWRIGPNSNQRFFQEPRIVMATPQYEVAEGTNLAMTLSVWDTIQRRRTTNATLSVKRGSEVLLTEEIELHPHWQETNVGIEVPGLAVGVHDLSLTIENVDGVSTTLAFSATVTSNLPLYAAIGAGGIVVLIVAIYLYRRR